MSIAIIIVVAAVSIWAIMRLTRLAPRPAPGGRTRSASSPRTSSADWGGTSGYVYGQGVSTAAEDPPIADQVAAEIAVDCDTSFVGQSPQTS